MPCDVDIDECANVTCRNNATCVEGLDWYRCDCVPGYTGEHCETGKEALNSFVIETLVFLSL